MDCRIVLILMLTTQAACRPVKREAEALSRTIQMIRNETRIALVKLNAPGLLPNTSCLSLNIAQYVGLEQDAITSRSFASFSCYLSEMSRETPDLREELGKASQYARNVKLHMNPTEAPLTCSLPAFKEAMGAYEFVRCYLQHLDERLSKGNF